MNRFFIRLVYKGTHFHGWQMQPNATSVQEEVEKALKTLFQEHISIVGCGRTDTGVHASQYFAHFDIAKPFSPDWANRLNGILTHQISIDSITPVKPEAHARFDALARTYNYYIHQKHDPFLLETSWLVLRKLDVELMNECAALLLQHKDFACFCKSGADNKTTLCDVTKAYWSIENNQLKFTITANRFLRNMVRAIVGTSVDIGLGKKSKEEFITILNSKERSKAGSSAPAQGLFLSEIRYNDSIFAG